MIEGVKIARRISTNTVSQSRYENKDEEYDEVAPISSFLLSTNVVTEREQQK